MFDKNIFVLDIKKVVFCLFYPRKKRTFVA